MCSLDGNGKKTGAAKEPDRMQACRLWNQFKWYRPAPPFSIPPPSPPLLVSSPSASLHPLTQSTEDDGSQPLNSRSSSLCTPECSVMKSFKEMWRGEHMLVKEDACIPRNVLLCYRLQNISCKDISQALVFHCITYSSGRNWLFLACTSCADTLAL